MQTSSKKLSAYRQKQLKDQFINLLADLKTPEECEAFYNSFLTETEQSVFGKRLAIMWMLEEGKSYQEIKDKLAVSSATISSVNNQLEEEGMRLAINKIKVERWADNWAKKILSWLPLR